MTEKKGIFINPMAILNNVSIKNRLAILGLLTALGFAIFGGVYTLFNNKTSEAFLCQW